MISLITPTGGRKAALSLCSRYMERQTYPGEVQWIIVNDYGLETVTLSRPGWEVVPVYPRPFWAPGQNTLARNLLAAIPYVAGDFILFIEDDDWYSPDYLTWMVSGLISEAEIFGERPACYYHLPSRRFRIFDNKTHSSLCQTGIRRSALPVLKEICASENFIDYRLWQVLPGRTWSARLCVGIKGMPGRPGIGIGHRPEGLEWKADPNLDTLRLWIGDDIANYEEYL